jgi:ubiquinone/menaquinone biosynthesis C-methylase UbiE
MHERRFRPSQMHRLEDPDRLKWLPPDEILARFGFQPGWTVADVGAGTGYFTLPIARAVGSAGRVFAVDVSSEMLHRLRVRLAEAALANVECVEAEASATTLPAGSCDLVLLANVWHEFDDHAAVLAEARRILSPAGRIALLDWRPDVEPDHGPPLEHRIAPEAAAHSLARAGFSLAQPVYCLRYSWLLIGCMEPARPA